MLTDEDRQLIAEALRVYANALQDPNYPLKNYFSVSTRAEKARNLADFVEPMNQAKFARLSEPK